MAAFLFDCGRRYEPMSSDLISGVLFGCGGLAMLFPVLNCLIFWKKKSWPLFGALAAVSGALYGVSLLAYSFEILRLVQVNQTDTILDTAEGYCLLFTFGFLAVVLLNLIACAVCLGRSQAAES